MKSSNKTQSILLLALGGNVLMVLARMFYSESFYYGFLIWNLFLAAVPLLISNIFRKHVKLKRVVSLPLLMLWLLFLPNAPYIITDLVHLYHRPPVPFWFDMCLVLLSAINGLALGFVSFRQIDTWIFQEKAHRYQLPFRIIVTMAVSYGVYLGRYLRFNSWDALLNPKKVCLGVINSLDAGTVGFVLTFSFITYIIYAFFHTIVRHHSQEVS